MRTLLFLAITAAVAFADDPPPKLSPPKLQMHWTNGTAGVISGQVFITTKGGANFKLGAVQVAIYPKADFDVFVRWRKTDGGRVERFYMNGANNLQSNKLYDRAIRYMKLAMAASFDVWDYLPESKFVAATDADGKFRLEHTAAAPFVVFARAKRLVGDSTEYYLWQIDSAKIPKSGELFLNNTNLQP